MNLGFRWLTRRLLNAWPWRGGLVLKAPLVDARTAQASSSKGTRRRKVLHIPSDAELLESWHVRRLAADLKGVGVSRRNMLDWLSDVVYGFKGDFIGPDGKIIPVPDLDDEFPESEEWNEEEKPDSYKWFSDFMRWADREPKQAIQKKVAARIRFIKMAMAVVGDEREKEETVRRLTVRSAILADLGAC